MRRAHSVGARRQPLNLTTDATYVETETVAIPGGEEIEVRLIAKGGRVGLGEITETGEPMFVPLERIRHRNADKGGTYRWHNDYRLRLGTGIITVRLYGNDGGPAAQVQPGRERPSDPTW